MINVEIKARCYEAKAKAIQIMLHDFARFHGEDRQRDTYFNVRNGRMKLRQGNIERTLVTYSRPDQAGPKTSKYTLVPMTAPNDEKLLESLTASLGILAVVDKVRQIFYCDNVKFHVDYIERLGYFVEIEARDEEETIGVDALRKQCDYFIEIFGIKPEALLTSSYSDMIVPNTNKETKMNNDRWLEGGTANKAQQLLAAAPFVPAKQISLGKNFQVKHMGVFVRVDPSWHDPQNIYGVSGLRLVKVNVDEQVQTAPN